MSEAKPWTPEDIPDLSGTRALVTGVTSGIGEKTVIELARHGAQVILGARNPAKLEASIRTIEKEVPGAALQPLSIDVSDLSSIRRAVSQVDGALDLLINNAGVMATPHERTADGLELQMATNHFGPFALTGLLFPRLVASGQRPRGGGGLRRPAGSPGGLRSRTRRNRSADTAGGVPTPSPSSPTSCSSSSSTEGPGRRAFPSRAWPRIPASPPPA